LFSIDSKQPHVSKISQDVLGKLDRSIVLSPCTVDHAKLSMIERIERALVLLAYFIEVDGDVHVPMYEKFEAELAELKKMEATKMRARQRLLACVDRGGRSAVQGPAVQAKHARHFLMSALLSASRWHVVAFFSAGWAKFVRAPSSNNVR
jgi:hypothetical protein